MRERVGGSGCSAPGLLGERPDRPRASLGGEAVAPGEVRIAYLLSFYFHWVLHLALFSAHGAYHVYPGFFSPYPSEDLHHEVETKFRPDQGMVKQRDEWTSGRTPSPGVESMIGLDYEVLKRSSKEPCV